MVQKSCTTRDVFWKKPVKEIGISTTFPSTGEFFDGFLVAINRVSPGPPKTCHISISSPGLPTFPSVFHTPAVKDLVEGFLVMKAIVPTWSCWVNSSSKFQSPGCFTKPRWVHVDTLVSKKPFLWQHTAIWEGQRCNKSSWMNQHPFHLRMLKDTLSFLKAAISVSRKHEWKILLWPSHSPEDVQVVLKQ